MSAVAIVEQLCCQWHRGCNEPHSGRPNKDGLLLCPRHANAARQQRDRDKRKAELTVVPDPAVNPFTQLRELVRATVEKLNATGAVNADDALELVLHGDELLVREALELFRLGRLRWSDLPDELRDVVRLAARTTT